MGHVNQLWARVIDVEERQLYIQGVRRHQCCLKVKREVYLLFKMHEYLASGHNVDEEGNESKPLCTEITTRT
jgi:hypothetical protein